MQNTISFHSMWDLLANAASCLAWLLFGIAQLHQEHGMIVGTPTVLINVIGLSVYTLLFIVKRASAEQFSMKVLILLI